VRFTHPKLFCQNFFLKRSAWLCERELLHQLPSQRVSTDDPSTTEVTFSFFFPFSLLISSDIHIISYIVEFWSKTCFLFCGVFFKLKFIFEETHLRCYKCRIYVFISFIIFVEISILT
jgi:hypothetical protein